MRETDTRSVKATAIMGILFMILFAIIIGISFVISGFIVNICWGYSIPYITDGKWNTFNSMWDASILCFATSAFCDSLLFSSGACKKVSKVLTDDSDLAQLVYGKSLATITLIIAQLSCFVIDIPCVIYSWNVIIPNLTGWNLKPINLPMCLVLIILYKYLFHKKLFIKAKDIEDEDDKK